MERFGQLIGLDETQAAEYDRLHAAVWPGVLATIASCNIRNYSIFRHGAMLFAYYEYVGEDHAADMAKIAADPITQQWWEIMNPMQRPLPGRAEGDWWLRMPEVFHTD